MGQIPLDYARRDERTSKRPTTAIWSVSCSMLAIGVLVAGFVLAETSGAMGAARFGFGAAAAAYLGGTLCIALPLSIGAMGSAVRAGSDWHRAAFIVFCARALAIAQAISWVYLLIVIATAAM